MHEKAAAVMMRRLLTVALITLLLDQAIKIWILEVVMNPPRVIEVLPIFNLVLVFNKGVSFGIFGGDGAWRPIALSVLALVITIGMLVWQWRQPTRLGWLGVGLIAGGAIGNVIDRLHVRAVVDYLDVHVGGHHWPAFNLADSAITIGVMVIIAVELLWKDKVLDKRAGNKQ